MTLTWPQDSQWMIRIYTGKKLRKQKQTTLNVISVSFRNGPKGDNTDWLKDFALSNKSYVIVGDFNTHAPFGENGCTSVTFNRLAENIVDSSLCLPNDGRITRIPDVSTQSNCYKYFLVTPDLAVNCTWYTEKDCLGSDHLSTITELNENIKDDEPEDEDKIPKFKYKHADWEAQNNLNNLPDSWKQLLHTVYQKKLV